MGNTSYGVYAQDHARYYDQTVAAGHAVRANLFYTGMAAAGREFQDYTYLSTADHLWNNIVNKQMYITGGVGAVGMDEAYGENYHLPNDGYCETCAQVAMGFFSEYLSLSFGDAKYADVVENYIYNGVLGGMGLNGDSFYYQQPLSAKEDRWDWINYTPCCPPMFLKFYSEMPTYIYSYTDEAVYVNQFVSSELTLDDGRRITMESGMPFEGNSTITAGKDTELRIRIPDWVGAGNETITVNGKTAGYSMEKGYAALAVKAGDKVAVSFPMEARRIYNDEQVTFTEGMVAFGYGPLVYCFESIDNPAIPGFSTGEFCMGVAPDARLATRFEADLLGGVTDITGMRILFEKPTQWTYTIEVSEDGDRWSSYQSETYNMTQDQTWREIYKAAKTRYIRLQITGTTGSVWASVWEFDVKTAAEPESVFAGLLENADTPSIRLDQETLTLKEGETGTLTAAVRPAGDKVRYISSDPAVAAVDDNGTVTAIKAGTAIITARTSGGAQAACTVTVTGKGSMIPGDMNGDGKVTIEDVMEACKVLARRSAGKEPTADEMARGNLDGDKSFTINDVMEICKILARRA